MGCKNGGEQKEEKKTEITELNNDLNNEKLDEEIHNLDYYKKCDELEEKNKVQEIISGANDYPQKMVEIFNKIRENPYEYANFIEDSMDYIKEITDEKNKQRNIIFDRVIKIGLTTGEAAFRKAANKLKAMDPLKPLEFKQNICIPLPNSDYDLNNKNYLKSQIDILRSNYRVDAYFKDIIPYPEISALMLMVDDIANKKYSGKRREIILRKDIKSVGISSGRINDKFVAYFTFS